MNENLIKAALRGETKRAQELLNQGADVNFLQSGYTALYYASSTGNIELVELLIMRGADANLGEYTPLGAAINRGHTEIVDLLLRNEANPSLKDELGCTALYYAVYVENVNYVKKLLEKEVDYSIRNLRGMTALDLARELGSGEIEKLITDKMKADRDKRKLK